MRQRKVKVWNKIVTIENVPDYMSDDELVIWAKRVLMLEGLKKQKRKAS